MPIDDITDLAQDVYLSVNGSQNDDTDEDLEIFQNDFIRSFNLWLDEYETEAYWNKLRVNDYVLDTVADTTTFAFDLPDDYRTPVFNQDKYVKFINDGTVIAKFKLVDPSQRVNDSPDDWSHPDRATFVDRKIVLSRAPRDSEIGSDIVLDVVKFHPRLTRTDSDGIALLPSRQLAVLGIAKNMSLANVTKVSLSPSFAQKYGNELNKQVFQNNQTNEVYDAQRTNFGYVDGIW